MPRDESPGTTAERSTWSARRLRPSPTLTPPRTIPAGDAPDWKRLRRHRRSDELAGAARRFNPGWARIGWTPAALVVDFVFVATAARNRATRMNERTHLLGDAGEIFLQWTGSDRYLELHVTPENRRLQLAWDAVALEKVRRGQSTMEDFAVTNPDWVESITHVDSSFWSARVVVPAGTIAPDLRSLGSDTSLLATVCRYDYDGHETPVLSATADFHGRPFHTRAAWDQLVLLPSEN